MEFRSREKLEQACTDFAHDVMQLDSLLGDTGVLQQRMQGCIDSGKVLDALDIAGNVAANAKNLQVHQALIRLIIQIRDADPYEDPFRNVF